MDTWKSMPAAGSSVRNGGSHEPARVDAENYVLEYLDSTDSDLIAWLERAIQSGRVNVCSHCYFAGFPDEDCRVCAGLPDRARTVFAEHDANELFGPYLRGDEDIDKELAKLRTERVETLYNLSEGAYEAVVALSIQAALNGIAEFWRSAEQRRDKGTFRLSPGPGEEIPSFTDTGFSDNGFPDIPKISETSPSIAGVFEE